MGNCEAKLSFEGFCIHASEGCQAKPLRKKEIPLEETGFLRKDKNNNNFQLQSYEDDEQTNMVHAMPKRPPVTRIEDENLGRSMESLKLREECPEKERSRQKKSSKENNKKEAIPSHLCGTPLSSVKAPEGYYEDNPAFDALRQQGIALKNGMLRNHEKFHFPIGMRPVPEVSGHPKDRQYKVVPERQEMNMQQQNMMYPTHTPDGFLIPPDIDVPPDGGPIPKKPSGRAPPTHEEIIINLTAEKDALEEKLLQERKDWRAEQKRLKNKISVLEKLSTDFKGSDEGLGKVVRELQAHAVQVEKERDAAQRKVRHLEKVMEKIVNDSSRQSAAALKLADSQEKMRGKILSSLDFYQQIPDK